jgi:ATPase subunit of ABC transporter with duplicated ATPase domains
LEVSVSLFARRVAKRFGDQIVFENLSLELHPGERVALLGRNGSGKTSLLRALAALDQPDAGEVVLHGTVAYLAQRGDLETGKLRDAVLPEALLRLKAELETAQLALAEPSDENLERFSRAEEAFRVALGYDVEARTAEVLAGLELDGDMNGAALSGGQTRRALLARLLLQPARFYLLDEPTNHLDEPSIAWLEGWIRDSDAAFLIVSHDRAFLDATVTRCYELERGQLNEYPGNYTATVQEKRTRLEAAKIAYQQHTRKVRQLEEQAALAAQQASRAENKNRIGNRDAMTASHLANRGAHKSGRRALALEKRISHMGEPEKPFEDPFMTRVPLEPGAHGPNEVLTLEDLSLTRGERVILERVTLHLRRGERVALTGPNGGGKSTLLAGILGQLEPRAGSIRHGVGLKLYWAGQNTEELDVYDTLEDALLGANPDLETRAVYARLASLGLPKDPKRSVSSLSGGQRTRLSLARLSVTRAQLLVLDEPTNNLDVDAIEALERLLLDYPGTVLFASHDRRLVQTVATKVWRVDDSRVTEVALES